VFDRVLIGLFALFLLGGCKAEIGDKCVLSTDCSAQNDRQCDTSQPGGYCTVLGCGPNTCASEASCILFNANAPGCPYDDRTPPRLAHSFCMKTCASNEDCREGYICRDSRGQPFGALVLDDDQNKTVCIARSNSDRNVTSSEVPNVCRAASPVVEPIDAGPGSIRARDAGAPIPVDAGGDGGTDAGITDAGSNDGSTDGASDAAH